MSTKNTHGVPNLVYRHPPREEITSELHHNYIMISEFGIATWDVIIIEYSYNYIYVALQLYNMQYKLFSM